MSQHVRYIIDLCRFRLHAANDQVAEVQCCLRVRQVGAEAVVHVHDITI